MNPPTVAVGSQSHAYSIAIDSTGQYVHVTGNADGNVWQYTIGPTGALTPMAFGVASGKSPVGIAAHLCTGGGGRAGGAFTLDSSSSRVRRNLLRAMGTPILAEDPLHITGRDATARLACRLLFILPPLAWGLVSGCGGAGNVQILADATTDGGGDVTSPPSDAGNGVDAGPSDAAVSDAAVNDAAPPCACAPGQTCCLYTSAGGNVQQQSCATTCALPDGGGHLSSLACTGSDCPNGDVCCIWRNGNDNVSQCKASCSNQNNEVQMCNAALADAGCPASQPCSSNNITDWNLSPPLATCGGQGVP